MIFLDVFISMIGQLGQSKSDSINRLIQIIRDPIKRRPLYLRHWMRLKIPWVEWKLTYFYFHEEMSKIDCKSLLQVPLDIGLSYKL